MPNFSTNRISRRNQNIKQDKIQSVNIPPSVNSLREGQEVIFQGKNKPLRKYLKHNGLLWSSDMSTDGNMFVEKKLTVNALEYKNSFIDYRVFVHNFLDSASDITTKHYLPWGDAGESTAMTVSSSAFVAPFKMTLHKILMRFASITSSDDVIITVEKSDDGDQVEDIIATATYDVSSVGAIAANTKFELNTSDFDNMPVVDAGLLCGIGIEFNSNLGGSYNSYWITSVWRIEVKF